MEAHDKYLQRCKEQITIFDIPILELDSTELIAAYLILEAKYHALKKETDV